MIEFLKKDQSVWSHVINILSRTLYRRAVKSRTIDNTVRYYNIPTLTYYVALAISGRRNFNHVFLDYGLQRFSIDNTLPNFSPCSKELPIVQSTKYFVKYFTILFLFLSSRSTDIVHIRWTFSTHIQEGIGKSINNS